MNLRDRNRYAAGLIAVLLPIALACNASTHVPAGSRQMIYSVVVAPTVHPRSVGLVSSPIITSTIPVLMPSATPTWVATATNTPSPSIVVERAISEETRDTVTVRVTTITRYYQIGGFSAGEISEQMRIFGPTDAFSGNHWYALTEPTFDWDDEGPCTDQGCAAGHVIVFLNLRYSLPQWTIGDRADPTLRAQWGAFSSALTIHEHGHGSRAIDCAWRLGAALAALRPAGDRPSFEQSMRTASDQVFAGCRQEQSQYEYETDHGRTQGVTWGP